MELIINLIIVFIIIFSLYKRFQEVSKKGSEIKPPTKSIPEPSPEMVDELKRITQKEEEVIKEEVVEETQPVPSSEDIFEKLRQEFAEPETFSEPSYVPEAAIPEQTEEPVPEIVQTIDYSKDVPRKKERRYVLKFGGSELVNGILMSEILGKPVSLRENV